MSQTTVLNATACQTVTALAGNHTTKGTPSSAINGGSSATAELRPAKPVAPGVSPELCIDALGCAVAGAAIGRSLALQTAGGLRLRAGFSVIVAVQDPTLVSTALAHILSPIKYAQAKRHTALAMLDPEVHQQTLDRTRREYLSFLERDSLPDSDHIAHFTQQIAALQAELRPMTLVENAAPGRLTLAIEKSPDHRLLAIIDDLSLSSLLDAARTPRGRLDFELLGKSFRQEIFDAAFLEGIHFAAVVSPMVSAIVIARPETVARLLMSEELEVARFADACVVINLAESAPARSDDTQARKQVAFWRETVARLVETPTEHAIVRMDSQAVALMEDFREQMAITLKDGQGDQGRYLNHGPVLASKIALGLWAGCADTSDSLTAQHAMAAIEIAKMNSRSRQAILQSWAGDWAKTELEKLCELALQKITQHGPLSGRDLCRRCHRKNLDQLDPALEHLTEAGRIAKAADGKYDLCERSLPELQVVEA